MNKVAVTGCPGAGKSTFARKLAGITGLPLFYLDMLWHLPDGSHVSRQEFSHSLDILLARDRFIIDGNYLKTLPARLEVCDTVFFLDYPLSLCLEGARERIGKKREDLLRPRIPRIHQGLSRSSASRNTASFRCIQPKKTVP